MRARCERPNSDRSLFSRSELPCAALVQIDCAVDTGCARAAICNGHAYRSVGAVRAAHGVKRQRRAPVHGHLDVAVPLLDSPASQIMHTLMLGSSELIRISGRAAGLLVRKEAEQERLERAVCREMGKGFLFCHTALFRELWNLNCSEFA